MSLHPESAHPALAHGAGRTRDGGTCEAMIISFAPMTSSALFSPFLLRGVTFRNRIFVSPMCQYSSENGLPTAWHAVHLGSRAVGGAGLVIVEASAVSPVGRITAWDSGLWSSAHADAFRPLVEFMEGAGAVAGIQIAHAGRKASTDKPWRGGRAS